MFWTKNLSGGQVMEPCSSGTMPWEFDLDAARSTYGDSLVDGVIKDKKSRSVFMTAPDTVWHVYTCAEGMDPTKRPSKENPVVKVTALVGDYDTPIEESHFENAKRLKLPPNWIEQSLSGNFRAIWLFEAPVGVVGSDHAKKFLNRLGTLCKMQAMAPALDKNSFNPAQTWTNGGAWLHIHDKPLSTDLLRGLVIDTLKASKKDGLADGVVTDIKAMAAALADKYPRFSQWPGEFEVESQGPSFWVDGTDSPKSAIVKPWGMFTFANSAAKSAYTWAELVGKDVADSIVAKKMSDAAGDIYYDGLRYFIKDARHVWHNYPLDPIKRMLKIKHGLSGTAGTEGYSQIDEALNTAEELNKVSTVAPCIPYEPGPIEVRGIRYLNSWIDLSVKPVAATGLKWGEGFEHIAEHISHVLTHPDAPDEPQYERFLDWLAAFYKSIHDRSPQSGQAIFVLGGTGVGKGLLSGIIEGLVGGATRAEEFLTGRSNFGGECYEQPLMCVDDLAGLDSRKEVIKFTENLKARVANAGGQNYHMKHRTPGNIPWYGRIMVTMNDDDNSMSVLPDFSASVEDKISLFHAAPTKSEFAGSFIPMLGKKHIIQKEAPAFARYLLEHYDRIPEGFKDSRYGVKAYHFSTLRAEIEDTQVLGTLAEPLRDFIATWFGANPNSPAWTGKASQLFQEMQGAGFIGKDSAYPHVNVIKLGRQLRREEAAGKKTTVVGQRVSNSRVSAIWTITKGFIEA